MRAERSDVLVECFASDLREYFEDSARDYRVIYCECYVKFYMEGLRAVVMVVPTEKIVSGRPSLSGNVRDTLPGVCARDTSSLYQLDMEDML